MMTTTTYQGKQTPKGGKAQGQLCMRYCNDTEW
jgi:hypothetical protein